MLIDPKTRELIAVDLTSESGKFGTGFLRSNTPESDNISMNRAYLSDGQKAIFDKGFATFHTHFRTDGNDPTKPSDISYGRSPTGELVPRLNDYTPVLTTVGHPAIIVSEQAITIHATLATSVGISTESEEFYSHPGNQQIRNRSNRWVLNKSHYNVPQIPLK